MDTTIFFAQFLGWVSIIAAVTYLLGGKIFLDELIDLHKDKGFVFLSGWMLLFLGLAIVILHNIWVADWRVVITAAGWVSIFKGVTRIAFPDATQKLIATFFKNKVIYFRVSMIVVGLLGVWLIYMS